LTRFSLFFMHFKLICLINFEKFRGKHGFMKWDSVFMSALWISIIYFISFELLKIIPEVIWLRAILFIFPNGFFLRSFLFLYFRTFLRLLSYW
jgi:hypothetical protein